jgi:type IV pilus assembly protein PilE
MSGATAMSAIRQLQSSRGFTLIELMIVVAIVGILAAVAYPAYEQYVQKGERARAKAFMLDVAQKEERYFSSHGAYCESATDCTWLVAPEDVRRYDVSVNVPGVAEDAESPFEVVAELKSGYSDPVCGTLTLTAMNVRIAKGDGPGCW